jgi:hypothetical protein
VRYSLSVPDTAIEISDGHYLLAAPSDPPAVADGSIGKLPYRQLRWDDFERLTVDIARRAEGYRDVFLYGSPGQNQQGIDVLAVGHPEQADVVFQCKQVEQFTVTDLQRAVDRWENGERPGGVERLIVVVAPEAKETALVERQVALLKREPAQVELWDATKLDEKLRKAPDVVSRFFGRAVAERFCDVSASQPDSVHEVDEFQSVRKRVGAAPLHQATTLSEVVEALGSLAADDALSAEATTRELSRWTAALPDPLSTRREQVLGRVRYTKAMSRVLRAILPAEMGRLYSADAGFTSASAFAASRTLDGLIRESAGFDQFANEVLDRVVLTAHDRAVAALLLPVVYGNREIPEDFTGGRPVQDCDALLFELSRLWTSSSPGGDTGRTFEIFRTDSQVFGAFRTATSDLTIGLLDFIPADKRDGVFLPPSALAVELLDTAAWWLALIPCAVAYSANWAPKSNDELDEFARAVMDDLSDYAAFSVGLA